MASRASREEWAERVARWKESGKTAAEFAKDLGVAANTLRWWSWRGPKLGRGKKSKRATRSVLSFLPVRAMAEPERPAVPLEICLASGHCVRITEEPDLGLVERVLEVLLEERR